LQIPGREEPTMEEVKKGRFSAGLPMEPTPNLGATD
jgi:hypothetical protein